MEQGPRGLVELAGKRRGQSMLWKVGLGDWTAKVRPYWLGELLVLYRGGQARIKSGSVGEGIQLWLELANRLLRARHEITSSVEVLFRGKSV